MRCHGGLWSKFFFDSRYNFENYKSSMVPELQISKQMFFEDFCDSCDLFLLLFSGMKNGYEMGRERSGDVHTLSG